MFDISDVMKRSEFSYWFVRTSESTKNQALGIKHEHGQIQEY